MSGPPPLAMSRYAVYLPKVSSTPARPITARQTPSVWLADALEQIGVQQLRHRGNWRYCFALGTKAQRRRVRIALPQVPYPKQPDPIG